MEFSEGSNLPVFFNVDSDLNGPGNVISGFESWTGDITGTSALYSSNLRKMAKSMLSENTVIKAANTKITELTTPYWGHRRRFNRHYRSKDPSIMSRYTWDNQKQMSSYLE